MKAISINLFVKSGIVAILLLGCAGATPLRVVDPSKAPSVTIACTGTASCLRSPQCGRCANCTEGFCDYSPLGVAGGKTCECYEGQVGFCYQKQPDNTWKLGLKRCERQSDGLSFKWQTTGAGGTATVVCTPL